MFDLYDYIKTLHLEIRIKPGLQPNTCEVHVIDLQKNIHDVKIIPAHNLRTLEDSNNAIENTLEEMTAKIGHKKAILYSQKFITAEHEIRSE